MRAPGHVLLAVDATQQVSARGRGDSGARDAVAATRGYLGHGARTSEGRVCEAYISGIPTHVASRELEIVGKMLNWPAENLHIRGLSEEFGPGNALTITVEHEGVTEVFTGFGEKGVSAESVAKRAVDAVRNYLASEAAVGPHLADQLLLPMALAGGGEFVTMPVTQDFESHVEIIRKFLERKIVTENVRDFVRVRVG
jgi:RNA 3'-terminal phosphate cyclase (ATP)